MMKKVWILLLGALIATVALQGCSSDSSEDAPAPVVIDTNVDTPAVPSDPGRIVLATLELGLGGTGSDTVTGRTQQAINLSGQPGTVISPTEFIGLGRADVNITGGGLTAPYACPAPSLQPICYACPNSLDPLTGLPLSPDPCGAVGARGAFDSLNSVIETTLTVSNLTTGLGTCDTMNYLNAGSTCNVLDALGAGLGVADQGCLPNSLNLAGTAVGYCLGDLVYNGSALGGGFCQDGATVCAEGNGDAVGINTDCLAQVCISDGLTLCGVDADCPGALLGDCPVGAIATGRCYTGCGACVPGRDLQCVAITYTGSQGIGTPTDLDGLGNVKCSGGPYAASIAGVNAVENPAPGTNDSWYVGNPGIAQGGSASDTISIDSLNDSYCVHTIVVSEDPRGNVDTSLSLDGPECIALCGDGYIANFNGEVCEPVPGDSILEGLNNDRGCPGTLEGGQDYCSNNPIAPYTACTKGNELADCGDATAICGAKCNPIGCGECVPPTGSLCGNGVLDAGETCDPGISPICCNAATCLVSADGAPDAACVAGDACNTDTCLAGACSGAIPVLDGTGCVGNGVAECTLADTCQAGLCADNDVAAATACGSGVAEPTCNADVCDGIGACTDVAALADGSLCADAGGDTCCAATCGLGIPGPGSCVASLQAIPTARRGTSPGYADDANIGMTGGLGGATSVYTIIPNDPDASVAVHGTDMMVFDIEIAGGVLAAEVITCTLNGMPTTNNCGVGDTGVAACLGYGAHPQVTGGGLDTIGQECVLISTAGLGAGGLITVPDEEDTSTSVTISCDVDAGAPDTQVVDLKMGFIGVRDQAVAAGTQNITADVFSYCSNGALFGGGEICGSAQGQGGIPVAINRGISGINTLLFYDPVLFDGGSTGASKPPATGRATGEWYQPAPNCPTAGIDCNPADGLFGCFPFGAGAVQMVGWTIPCNGTIMLDAGGCTLTTTSSPVAGTVSTVDAGAMNVAFTAFTNDLTANPIRGFDVVGFVPSASTNVTGYIIWE